jgi:hypothetical protein
VLDAFDGRLEKQDYCNFAWEGEENIFIEYRILGDNSIKLFSHEF